MHYKDGTQAQIGDIARGKGYNFPYPVQGVVTRLVPGTGSCDITVHFTGLGYPIDPKQMKPGQFANSTPGGALALLEDGRLLPTNCEQEHGTCGEFELVYRPTEQPNGALK
jgi:hypothetical protein